MSLSCLHIYISTELYSARIGFVCFSKNFHIFVNQRRITAFKPAMERKQVIERKTTNSLLKKVSERSKKIKKPVNSTIPQKLAAIGEFVQIRPQIPVKRPKMQQKNGKVVIKRKQIQETLLAADTDPSVEASDLLNDSRCIRDISLKKNEELFIVPRDIGVEKLEEFKRRSAADRSIDILSVLRQHSTQTLVVKQINLVGDEDSDD